MAAVSSDHQAIQIYIEVCTSLFRHQRKIHGLRLEPFVLELPYNILFRYNVI
jgi:hypothetical protein